MLSSYGVIFLHTNIPRSLKIAVIGAARFVYALGASCLGCNSPRSWRRNKASLPVAHQVYAAGRTLIAAMQNLELNFHETTTFSIPEVMHTIENKTGYPRPCESTASDNFVLLKQS